MKIVFDEFMRDLVLHINLVTQALHAEYLEELYSYITISRHFAYSVTVLIPSSW